MTKLKQERDEQLAEQAELRAKELAKKKQEEKEARSQVVAEQKAKMRELEAEKARRTNMVLELQKSFLAGLLE